MGKRRTQKPQPRSLRLQNIPKGKRKVIRSPRTVKLETAIAFDYNKKRKRASWTKYKNGYTNVFKVPAAATVPVVRPFW